MAINIYSGGSPTKTPGAPRISSAAQRAQATVGALKAPAAASDSGSTAVKSGGILQKIGNVASGVGKVAGFLKDLPIPGLQQVASVVHGVLSHNAPYWWQHVPGDGLTTNAPLRDQRMGSDGEGHSYINVRPAILNIYSSDDGDPAGYTVIHISDRMATQYLMPAVRKVTNAVLLQDAGSYKRAAEIGVTLYAIWRTLKKHEAFTRSGKTFLPTMNDPAFPVYQVENAAWLQSTITRLEEFLHASIRLPHTVCEYVSWRFGRMFRSNMSAKAAFVSYDPFPMDFDIKGIQTIITGLEQELSSTPELQKASSDLYNAYVDHDLEVNEDTLYEPAYDDKEFCLRTNLDLLYATDVWDGVEENEIIIDSNLDNPTVFMASTVSTTHGGEVLFPVWGARVFRVTGNEPGERNIQSLIIKASASLSFDENYATAVTGNSLWYETDIRSFAPANPEEPTPQEVLRAVGMSLACKAVDFYNVGIFVGSKDIGNGYSPAYPLLDLTSISIDAGLVPDVIIQNEQVIAFANLFNETDKTRTTTREIEKEAAHATANFIEKMDVATVR